MNRKQVALTIGLAVISSFVGGALSSQLFVTRPALAGAREFAPRPIVGSEFRLLDRENRTRALLNLESKESETSLMLFDQHGRPRIKLFVDRDGNSSGHFWDKQASYRYRRPGNPSVIFYDSRNDIRGRLP